MGAALFENIASSRRAESSGISLFCNKVPVTGGCGEEVAVEGTLLFLRVVPIVFMAFVNLVATNLIASEEEFLAIVAFKSFAALAKISSIDPPGMVYLSGK